MKINTSAFKEQLTEMEKNPIVFTVEYDGEENRIETYAGEYRNLMVLLNDKFYLENFGECGGMGRCATCLVEIKAKDSDWVTMERNEASTLAKAGIQQPCIRLACQIYIEEELQNAVIKVGCW